MDRLDPPDGAAAGVASLALSIPAPRERQETVLREALAPLLRDLRALGGHDGFHFDRLNKPDWRLGITVHGSAAWLEHVARPFLEDRSSRLRQRGIIDAFTLGPEPADDKWIGGGRERVFLRSAYFVDSLAALDLIEAEARGLLGLSRAEWSLRLIERLLDLFGLHAMARIDFYRRGYQWAVLMGRWDAAVFAALEEKYRAQQSALAAALDPGEESDPQVLWGGEEPARIARECLGALGPAVQRILAARADGRLDRDIVEIAGFAAHAHSNRLGIHATQEAMMRYLVYRARTEGRVPGD